MISLILSLVLAGVAGWFAGQLMKTEPFGVIGNVVLGIVGGFVGRAMLWLIGFTTNGIIANLIAAVLGAIVLIYVVGELRKRGTI